MTRHCGQAAMVDEFFDVISPVGRRGHPQPFAHRASDLARHPLSPPPSYPSTGGAASDPVGFWDLESTLWLRWRFVAKYLLEVAH
jgi:hypothetical protein